MESRGYKIIPYIEIHIIIEEKSKIYKQQKIPKFKLNIAQFLINNFFGFVLGILDCLATSQIRCLNSSSVGYFSKFAGVRVHRLK